MNQGRGNDAESNAGEIKVEIQRKTGGWTVIREIAYASVPDSLVLREIPMWSIKKSSNYNLGKHNTYT